MKTFSILFLSIVLAASCYGTTRRVLFLGNSYTYVNNMPQIVADLAHATGDSLYFDMYTPGGYTLDQHAMDPIGQGKVMAGNWDYLVLQEQSQLPAFPGYFSNNLSGLCSLFRAYNPCGRVLFYMTWGRKNGDATNCANFPSVCTYIGMDTTIQSNYIDMATFSPGDLSPVGAVWRYIRQHSPTIELYQSDESHPSEAGSYLAACSFYTTIFKKNPVLNSYNYVLATADANIIKQAAKLVVFDSLAYWRHSSTTLTADFYYNIGTGTNLVNFANTTSTLNTIPIANSYLWDFGDGFTSTQKDPSHSYANNGTYTVTLTSYNCDIDTTYQSSHQETVSFCSFTPTIYPTNLILCPGITDTLWTQTYNSYQWFDEFGNPIPNATNRYYVATGGNRYHVMASQNGCSEMSVPVLVDAYTGLTNQFYLLKDGALIGQDSACIGSRITLMLQVNKPPFPNDSLIDWSVNGNPIAGYHNDTLVITTSGVYEVTLHHPFCPNLDRTEQVNFTFVNCPAGVGTQVPETPVTVYPNPGNGLFILDSRRKVDITIFNSYGKSIWSQRVDAGKRQIDLHNQPAGMYLIHVSGDGIGQDSKLIIE